jgi:hypothetical protein
MQQSVAFVTDEFGDVRGEEAARWLLNLYGVDEQSKLAYATALARLAEDIWAAPALVVKSPTESEQKAREGGDDLYGEFYFVRHAAM